MLTGKVTSRPRDAIALDREPRPSYSTESSRESVTSPTLESETARESSQTPEPAAAESDVATPVSPMNELSAIGGEEPGQDEWKQVKQLLFNCII